MFLWKYQNITVATFEIMVSFFAILWHSSEQVSSILQAQLGKA